MGTLLSPPIVLRQFLLLLSLSLLLLLFCFCCCCCCFRYCCCCFCYCWYCCCFHWCRCYCGCRGWFCYSCSYCCYCCYSCYCCSGCYWCCCFLASGTYCCCGGVADFGLLFTASFQSPRTSVVLRDISVLTASAELVGRSCGADFLPGHALDRCPRRNSGVDSIPQLLTFFSFDPPVCRGCPESFAGYFRLKYTVPSDNAIIIYRRDHPDLSVRKSLQPVLEDICGHPMHCHHYFPSDHIFWRFTDFDIKILPASCLFFSFFVASRMSHMAFDLLTRIFGPVFKFFYVSSIVSLFRKRKLVKKLWN